MTIRTARWLAATALGLSAVIAGACGSDPQLTNIDTDGDGYFDKQDCDDDNSKVSPSAFENCTDGKDNDCDGKVDAADTECGAPTGGSGVGVGGGGGAGSGGGGAGGAGKCSPMCLGALKYGTPLCIEAAPASVSAYNAAVDCACNPDPVVGKCAAACSDDFCVTKSTMAIPSGSPCLNCVINTQTGCGTPFAACEAN